jgi:hypothetical protein
MKKVVRISSQVITSASLIAAGILIGLNPIGAMLGLTGVCLATAQESESVEEYNAEVIAHFEERGEKCPAWALKGAHATELGVPPGSTNKKSPGGIMIRHFRK